MTREMLKEKLLKIKENDTITESLVISAPILALTGMLGVAEICGINTFPIPKQNEIESSIDAEISQEKVFEVGTHVLVQELDYNSSLNDWNQIVVPEGYELTSVNAMMGNEDSYMAVMTNIVPVDAIGYYNEETSQYLFSQPGTPVEETLKLQKTR